MKLIKTYKGIDFEIPVPWGTSDHTHFYKNYALSYNDRLCYAYVRRFDKEEWASVFKEALAYAKPDEDGCYGASWERDVNYYLENRVQGTPRIDDIWIDEGGGDECQLRDMFETLLQHKKHRDRYSEDDVIQLIKDYPTAFIKELVYDLH